jgi:hypothetical protein
MIFGISVLDTPPKKCYGKHRNIHRMVLRVLNSLRELLSVEDVPKEK